VGKLNIVIPIAGRAQRFIDEGYTAPKPLIIVKDRHMIEWAMSSIDANDARLIFIVRRDHVNAHSIDKILKSLYGSRTEVIVADKITRGTLETCLLARELIDNDDPMIVYTPDVYFGPAFDPGFISPDDDGFLLTFKANSPAHSYAKVENGVVVRTAEKDVISSHAAVGVYYFKRGSDYVKYADEMIRDNITVNGEFYVCPIYNLLIRDGLRVTCRDTQKMHVLGTPDDLEFFTTNVMRRFGELPVALCADHSGFKSKEAAKKILVSNKIQYIDFGTYIEADCDHYDFLSQAARHIQDRTCQFGMAFCRTGQGFNIAANKIKGIRSALIFDDYTARYAIEHNCANFFAIPSRNVDDHMLDLMVKELMKSSFDGGRHATRVRKMDNG